MIQLNERYRILGQIGKGGFGVTFLAEDTLRPGNPKCVVKQFKPMVSDPKNLQYAKRLFNNEAIILENLGHHDQIPRLLAYFEENQEFYLVQEYIQGQDLSAELLPGKRFSEHDVIELLIKILEVLNFVHQQNVIHRDIKPSNIIRREDGKIVLIDFGAVKQISTQVINDEGYKTVTAAVGTPGYMPSEQAGGDPNFCSDVYAVGIMGIQALTGLLPNQLQKDSLTREIIWHNQVQVSQELASILDTMVRFDCRQRYQSADEALQALQKISPGLLPNYNYNIAPTVPITHRRIYWKWIIALGLLIVIISATTIITKLPRVPPQTLDLSNYEDTEVKIKIKYPQTWNRQDLRNPITGEWVKFLSPKQSENDSFQEQLTIKIESFSGTLEDSKNTFIKEIKDSTKSQDIKSDTSTLAFKSAYQLIYTVKDGQDNLKNLRIWTLKGDKAYIIVYTAAIDDYDKFLQTAETMIKSFEIGN